MRHILLSGKFLSTFGTFTFFFAITFMIIGICHADELVLHLTFDDLRGDVAEDISKFGNDATFNGDVELITGKYGKALEFDGASWGEIPDHDSLDMVDGITIHFWTNIRASAGGPGSDVQTGVEKGTTWKPGLYTLAAHYRGGSLLQFFDLPDNCREQNIGDNIQDEKWHHLAGTWDGTTIKLFIDGQLNRELECKGTLTGNNEPLFIGARGGNQRFINGALDEIKMYDYPLTEDELRMDMENPQAASVLPQDKLTTTWALIKRGN